MSSVLKEMNGVQNLLSIYTQKLDKMGVTPQKADTSEILLHDKLLCHVAWMIIELSPMVIHAYESYVFDADKATARKEIDEVHRWLGYIQGVLSAQRIYTIDDLRDQTRLVFDLQFNEISSSSSQD